MLHFPQFPINACRRASNTSKEQLIVSVRYQRNQVFGLLCDRPLFEVFYFSMCAEQFLTDGDISVDIGIAAAPVITANYIESYHKVNDDFRYIVEYTAVLDRL